MRAIALAFMHSRTLNNHAREINQQRPFAPPAPNSPWINRDSKRLLVRVVHAQRRSAVRHHGIVVDVRGKHARSEATQRPVEGACWVRHQQQQRHWLPCCCSWRQLCMRLLLLLRLLLRVRLLLLRVRLLLL